MSATAEESGIRDSQSYIFAQGRTLREFWNDFTLSFLNASMCSGLM